VVCGLLSVVYCLLSAFPVFLFFQHSRQLFKWESIDHILCFQPTTSGSKDAVFDIAKHLEIVTVGVDTDQCSLIAGHTTVNVAQVQARRVGVDLQTDPVLPSGFDHLLQVNLIGCSSREQAPGGMSQDIDIGVLQGTTDSQGHLLAGKIEPAVNRSNDKIEARKNFIAEIQFALT